MNKYAHDDLLAAHFEKVAIMNMLGAGIRAAAPKLMGAGASMAKGVMNYGSNLMNAGKNLGFGGSVSNLARGFFGMAPKAMGKNTRAAAGTLHNLGQGASMAHGALSTASQMLPSSTPNANQDGQMKMNSLRETRSKFRVKQAGHSLAEKALHIAPYTAWIAAQLLGDSHPRLSKGLNLGAYGLYAGMAGRDALRNPSERITSGIDAAALTAMGLADLARMRRKSLNLAEGH